MNRKQNCRRRSQIAKHTSVACSAEFNDVRIFVSETNRRPTFIVAFLFAASQCRTAKSLSTNFPSAQINAEFNVHPGRRRPTPAVLRHHCYGDVAGSHHRSSQSAMPRSFRAQSSLFGSVILIEMQPISALLGKPAHQPAYRRGPNTSSKPAAFELKTVFTTCRLAVSSLPGIGTPAGIRSPRPIRECVSSCSR